MEPKTSVQNKNNLHIGLTDDKPQLKHLQERIGHSMKDKKELTYLSGVNPLVANASPLLKRVIYLRTQKESPDMKKLREEIIQNIEEFERASLVEGIENSQVLAARYILCAVVDEIISTTSWGEESEWSTSSLQAYFHDESYGGERFFSLLEYLLRNPAVFIFILEFMYILLAVGFKGKYRIASQGHDELISIKENLFNQIQIIRGRPPVELSPNSMKNLSSQKQGLFYTLPRGYLSAVVFCVVGLIYGSLTFVLGQRENIFYEKIYSGNQPYVAPQATNE